jgi:hypothetical protein
MQPVCDLVVGVAAAEERPIGHAAYPSTFMVAKQGKSADASEAAVGDIQVYFPSGSATEPQSTSISRLTT